MAAKGKQRGKLNCEYLNIILIAVVQLNELEVAVPLLPQSRLLLRTQAPTQSVKDG